jgi:hypothetical protein
MRSLLFIWQLQKSGEANLQKTKPPLGMLVNFTMRWWHLFVKGIDNATMLLKKEQSHHIHHWCFGDNLPQWHGLTPPWCCCFLNLPAFLLSYSGIQVLA